MPQQPDPSFPRLRPLDVQRTVDHGQAFFLLRDPLGLAEHQVLVPEALGTLLSLCDGTRDIPTLSSAFLLRTGIPLPPSRVEEIVGRLGEALFLDDDRFAQAVVTSEREYRCGPYRRPALAGKAYPADPDELAGMLQGYCQAAVEAKPGAAALGGSLVGLLSPHIDYQRGGPVYAGVWRGASRAIEGVELVVIFGTDHSGGPGRLTLTRQSYATPWGVLPTAQPIVDALARELGDEAFEEEIHHRNEHSIELALVWLHYFLRPRSCEVMPILCGSFHPFVTGDGEPGGYEPFRRALDVLAAAMAGRRALVVAAADLAHVGPVFGDPAPAGRVSLRSADDLLLEAVAQGDPQRFFSRIEQEGDRRRICGMPPIYLMLRLLAGASGQITGYDQCPADPQGGSLVSIAGALLRRAS